MKKLFVLFVLSLSIQFTAISQTCLPEGIEFIYQEEIDNFQTNYPNCTKIEGNVVIHGDVNNLNGLNVLTSMGGLLIWSLDSLTSLSGLENITNLGSLLIHYCPRLENLAGFENLDSLDGEFQAIYNDSLTSFYGLHNVTHIDGSLNISHNKSLKSLEGFNSLSSLGGYIFIADNDSLINLTGLENLTSITIQLVISANKTLNSLSGIDNINPNTFDYLYIQDNPLLSTCEVKSVCDYLMSSHGGFRIRNNAYGCDSIMEVEEACAVGIPEISKENTISIYPNPAKGELFIKNTKNTKIDKVIIYNQFGQRVFQSDDIVNKIDV